MPLISARYSFLLDAPAERVWPALANSDQVNRVFKDFSPLRFEPMESTGPERLKAFTRAGPFSIIHEELPPQFVAYEWVQIDRPCLTGPFKHLRVRREMAPAEGGTRVTVTIEVDPRWSIMNPLTPVLLARQVKRFAAFLTDRVKDHGASRFPEPRTALDEKALARAEEELARQPGASSPLVDRLIAVLRKANDSELVRLRPFALADEWGVARDEVLDVMLLASLAGMLELLWDTVCPSCQIGSAQVPILSELGAAGHCQMCDLRFDLDLDRAVEAIFRPSPSIRPVPTTPFCLASAAQLSLVHSQGILRPGETLSLKTPDASGAYRLFVRGGAMARVLVTEGAPTRVTLPLSEPPELPAEIEVAPSGSVELAYSGSRGLHAKIERVSGTDLAATAHRVALRPLFRRHFSSELLKPGLALAISRVSIVFTDLTGSTALYASLGEPHAFRIVLDHFELLRTIIESHHGTIVKTIGDAVMAAFPDEAAAFSASLAMIDAFPGFAARHPEAEELGLKVGAFTGPCFGVRANDVLDYFGQTVNTAARIQGAAASGELVVDQATARAAIRDERISPLRVSEPFEAHLKGLPEPLRLVRIAASAAALKKSA